MVRGWVVAVLVCACAPQAPFDAGTLVEDAGAPELDAGEPCFALSESDCAPRG